MCAVHKCMHACMHASIHASIHTWIHTYIHYISLHCIALHCITLHYITLHYIQTYIHTWSYMYTVGYIYILLFYCIYIIYIHMCVFSCSLSAPPGLFAKKQRISYSPQKGWNVTHFAMFDWRRVPHSTDSSSCSPMKKKTSTTCRICWVLLKTTIPLPQFSILFHSWLRWWNTIVFGSTIFLKPWATPDLLEAVGSWILEMLSKGAHFYCVKNTPCSTEWIYYIYNIHIISYI